MTKLKINLFVLLISFTAIITACVSEKTVPNDKLPPKKSELQPKEVDPVLKKLAEIKGKALDGLVLESPFSANESTMKQVKLE